MMSPDTTVQRAVFVFMVFIAVSLPTQAQQGTGHARDTTSFFPVGFYTFYICRGMPPFSFDPITGYPPVHEDIMRWVQRDSANIANVNANYFVDWIPRVYWHMVDPGPPIIRDHVPFEDDIFRHFAVANKFKMDYKNNAPWHEPLDLVHSVQERVQQPPATHPPRNASDLQRWVGWEDSLRTELLRIRDEVDSDSPTPSPYHTFYTAHEVDLYPDLRDNHGEITDAGRVQRYAVQRACEIWDEVGVNVDLKPFVVIGPLERWPHILDEIAATCRNLRMIAMDGYVIDTYVNTTHTPTPGDSVYGRGQRDVFGRLANMMTGFWEAFEVNIPFDRQRENLPIERWFIGQAYKCYDVDNNGWAISQADFDWDNQHETRKYQHGSAKRYPTYEELRLQASLALSRGFKGIIWYTYGSANAETPITDAPVGVVDSLRRPINEDVDLGMNPAHPCSELVRPFDNVARVNAELQRIGPAYRKLELMHVFDQQTIPENAFGLYAVESDGLFGDEALDISVFRRYDCDSCWYLMFVSKVINSSQDPCQVDLPRTVVVRMANTGVEGLTAADGGADAPTSSDEGALKFRFEIEPGQGRLFIVDGLHPKLFSSPVSPGSISISVSPNPVVPGSVLHLQLPRDATVSLSLYDLLGRKVEQLPDRYLVAGNHSVPLEIPSKVSAGIYIVVAQTPFGNAWSKVAVLL